MSRPRRLARSGSLGARHAAGGSSVATCRSCASPSPRSTPPSATSPATPRMVVERTRRGGRGRRPPGGVPRDGPDRLPGRGPRAAPVLPAGLDQRRWTPWPRPWPTRAWATSPAIVGYLDLRRRRRRPPAGHPARRAASTPPPCCTAGRSSPATPSTTCPTTASSTSSATSCPATDAVRRAGRTASTSPWRSARTSGRTAARSPRCARPAPGCSWSSTARPTSAQGRRPPGAVPRAARSRPGAALAYVNMVGGQDELVFDGDSLVVGPDGELVARAPQFDERAARRRPRPPRGRRVLHGRDPRRAGRAVRAAPPPGHRAAARRRGRDVRRPGPRAARLRAQERLPLGHVRAVRRHRLRAGRRDRRRRDRRRERATASRCRASTPRSTPRTTPSTSPSGIGAAHPPDPDRPDGRRLHGLAWS